MKPRQYHVILLTKCLKSGFYNQNDVVKRMTWDTKPPLDMNILVPKPTVLSYQSDPSTEIQSIEIPVDSYRYFGVGYSGELIYVKEGQVF